MSQTAPGHAGCGVFAAALLRALVGVLPDARFLLYPVFGTDFWEPRVELTLHPGGNGNVARVIAAESHLGAKQLFGPPLPDLEERLGSPSLVHSNNFFCPRGLRRARLVYTLYDTIALDYPEWLAEDNRAVCSQGLVEASLRADALLAISRASRERFLALFPHYPPERVQVVEPASRFDPRQGAGQPIHGLAPGFWLWVGPYEPRKNLARVLAAHARLLELRPDAGPLVLCAEEDSGQAEQARRSIERLSLNGHVRRLGRVSDRELAWLYANCRALLYPSLVEGYGLPVVEAMSLGAPVVTSSISSLPEAAGGAALLVDPTNEAALSAALLRLHDEPELRERLTALGRERVARRSWEHVARQVGELYRETLARPALELPLRS